MLPAPGQGALAVQCRADDHETLELLAAIHDPLTAAAVSAERAFLSGLGGGCSLPVAAFAQKNDGQYHSDRCSHFSRWKTSHPLERCG